MTTRENQDVQDNIPPAADTAPSAAKQPAPAAKGLDGQSVLKRSCNLSFFSMCGDPGISAFPEGDNIFCWKGTITGSKDTVYEGMIYKLFFYFPTDYPFKPPKVKFETACFHPNVDIYGNICLDILQDKWSSAYDVRTILLSIQSLLGGNKHELCYIEELLYYFANDIILISEPNNESPLNTQAAALWVNQEGEENVMSPLLPFDIKKWFLIYFSKNSSLSGAEFRKMVEKLYKPA
ncbi:hypothetical protein GW17_00016416 [Ensete ventricosum]|nr:hypothetical protein GW17_00016416 [Ensete ventricosum]